MRQKIHDILARCERNQQFLAAFAVAACSELALHFPEPRAEQRKTIIANAMLEAFKTGGQNIKDLEETTVWNSNMVQMVREYPPEWSIPHFTTLAQAVTVELDNQAKGLSKRLREKDLRQATAAREWCDLSDPLLVRSLPLLLEDFIKNFLEPFKSDNAYRPAETDRAIFVMCLILAKVGFSREQYAALKAQLSAIRSNSATLSAFWTLQSESIKRALFTKYPA